MGILGVFDKNAGKIIRILVISLTQRCKQAACAWGVLEKSVNGISKGIGRYSPSSGGGWVISNLNKDKQVNTATSVLKLQ